MGFSAVEPPCVWLSFGIFSTPSLHGFRVNESIALSTKDFDGQHAPSSFLGVSKKKPLFHACRLRIINKMTESKWYELKD